jgi:hypothetical protein
VAVCTSADTARPIETPTIADKQSPVAIMPKVDMRDYVLKVMASCLDGVIREERFHIWTGNGSNGK